jgi:uncharacterized protein
VSAKSRRAFLGQLAGAGVAVAADPPAVEPIIDIHQHVGYHGRSDEHLVAHQRAMGITHTLLLPAGRPVSTASTHQGKSNGLAAKCGGNAAALELVKAYPGELFLGANEVTDDSNAVAEIEKYLKLGAVIIGEQKFSVQADSAESQRLFALAADYQVPILLHFQEGTYNHGYDRLPALLRKHPKTIFIGHAQTVWAHIDAAYSGPGLYPKGAVKAGGLTDRYLADYENFYADMSAGSGLNALTRDEEHTRGFLDRHQDKILYGSDCADHFGRGPGCQGASTLAAIRQLAPNKAAEQKILFANSKRVFQRMALA